MKKCVSPFRVIIFLIAAAGLVWFLIPLGWHILNIGNGSGLAVCLVLMAGSLLWGKIRAACRRSKPLRGLVTVVVVLLCAGAVWSAAMTVCMISAAAAAPPESATVVVLGSMVNGKSPSADLWWRISTASAYLKAHPEAKCVASGGQGPHESATEASVIKQCLAADGIDPSRVLTEETSRSTKENLANSLKIIDRSGLNRKLAIVTDDYHEFRACSIARKQNAEPYAVPSKTPWFILSSCWAREVLALTKYLLIPG
jgi:uncharacterized SAM-binding protein YcdF (DUF218 family)